jgi:GTP-binding protein
MRVIEAKFEKSASGAEHFPPPGEPEIAFVGRSNVGKSSLLQALTKREKLVRISATPGRTRLVNFFLIETEIGPLRFVDLPGYGYAKVSKEERKHWFAFVEQYLASRAPLKVVVLLMDARRGPDACGLDEIELVKWLAARGVAVLPVATKCDKLSKHERKPAADKITRALGVTATLVSATTGDGLEEVWRRIAKAVNIAGN